MSTSHRRATGVRLTAVDAAALDESQIEVSSVTDSIAVEEPLEIRIGDGRTVLRSVVTMRTPGADLELAAGWLRGEGIVRTADDLVAVRACTDPSLIPEARDNVVTADLAPTALPRLAGLSRTTDITGACGVCGSESLADILGRELPPLPAQTHAPNVKAMLTLPERLAEAQKVFARTGGLHGAAVADASGALLVVREDIGRHNAVDKVLGWSLMHRQSPTALVASSRASFEIVQKAAMAGVPVVVTVSAPSSLAIDLAQATGITLLAFARDGRATAYSHPDRLMPSSF